MDEQSNKWSRYDFWTVFHLNKERLNSQESYSMFDLV